MKKIKFASEGGYLVHPQSASKYIPGWYKKAERFVGGKPIINSQTSIGKQTVKSCFPFLDSLTSGYMVELWQDIQVVYENDFPIINWETSPSVVSIRDNSSLQGMPIGDEYFELNFAWDYPFFMETPPGYSVLITHPHNRYDLPFTTMSGVVDADSIMANGSLPFLLKKNFTGIIEKGTPIAQILPFKRESWSSVVDNSLVERSASFRANVHRVVSGWYKKHNWKKKTYS